MEGSLIESISQSVIDSSMQRVSHHVSFPLSSIYDADGLPNLSFFLVKELEELQKKRGTVTLPVAVVITIETHRKPTIVHEVANTVIIALTQTKLIESESRIRDLCVTRTSSPLDEVNCYVALLSE